ncbi:MAG: ABC transporter substrate-binding protein [bacterium]|nr:ABC transporter substrate-binding protein [bacterium]
MMRKYLGISSLLLVVMLIFTSLTSSSFAQKMPNPSQYNTPLDYQRATGKRITKFNEAPILTELVKAGKLPPVEKRLPTEPLVIVPVEEVGQYGGTANVFSTSPTSYDEGIYLISFEGLVKLGPDATSVIPNIAKSWRITDGGKTLTIVLRKGIKWSTGAPFTADDILFWWEDVVLNDDLTPVKPRAWAPGGKLMTVEKVDDYTIKMRFASPYAPFALLMMAHAWSLQGVGYYPKHYSKNFHPKYVPLDELNKRAKSEGFNNWWELFWKYNSFLGGGGAGVEPGAPTMQAFMLTKKGTDFIIAERNPYYWKIDIAGNQLPYIDRVQVNIVTNTEVQNMKAVAGEADLAGMQTMMENYTLYKENEKRGNYRVLLWQRVQGTDVAYQLNLTYTDDLVLRDIFRDVRFRKALSLAINRDEINQALYYGMATPRQACPIPTSPYFEEQFANAYIRYDPKEANRLLDEMGLKRGPDGYRLRPDGKRLEITLEYVQMETPKRQTTEFVVRYWDAIGIKVAVKEVTGELQSTRVMANKMQMSLWHADRCGFLFPLEPFWWVPMRYQWEVNWCPLWAQWYTTGGKAGEEPPKELKRLIDLWEKMKVTTSEKERIRLGKEILKSNAENLWTIGTVGLAPHPVIVRTNLRNIPEKSVTGWDTLWSYPYNPCQFFFKK